MSGFASWDINDTTLILCGVPLHDSGIGKGETFATLEFESPDYEDAAGSDGHVTRHRNHDGRATLTIRAVQSSALNDRLMAILTADRLAPNGAAVGGCLLADSQGRHVISASKAWVMGPPEGIEFGKEPKEFEWKIRLADAKGPATFHGGRG